MKTESHPIHQIQFTEEEFLKLFFPDLDLPSDQWYVRSVQNHKPNMPDNPNDGIQFKQTKMIRLPLVDGIYSFILDVRNSYERIESKHARTFIDGKWGDEKPYSAEKLGGYSFIRQSIFDQLENHHAITSNFSIQVFRECSLENLLMNIKQKEKALDYLIRGLPEIEVPVLQHLEYLESIYYQAPTHYTDFMKYLPNRYDRIDKLYTLYFLSGIYTFSFRNTESQLEELKVVRMNDYWYPYKAEEHYEDANGVLITLN